MGDRLKTAPRDYARDHPDVDDLRRTDFIGITPLTRQQITGDKIVPIVIRPYQEGQTADAIPVRRGRHSLLTSGVTPGVTWRPSTSRGGGGRLTAIVWLNSSGRRSTANFFFGHALNMSNAPEQRELKFENLDQVVAEAERLASMETRTTGNHSFGQILRHLALSQNISTGHAQPPRPPLLIRLMMPLMKRMVINDKPLKPGIKLPPKAESFFWAEEEIEVGEALQLLKDSTERYKARRGRWRHIQMFGKLSREQNEQLNCRHAALHLASSTRHREPPDRSGKGRHSPAAMQRVLSRLEMGQLHGRPPVVARIAAVVDSGCGVARPIEPSK